MNNSTNISPIKDTSRNNNNPYAAINRPPTPFPVQRTSTVTTYSLPPIDFRSKPTTNHRTVNEGPTALSIASGSFVYDIDEVTTDNDTETVLDVDEWAAQLSDSGEDVSYNTDSTDSMDSHEGPYAYERGWSAGYLACMAFVNKA